MKKSLWAAALVAILSMQQAFAASGFKPLNSARQTLSGTTIQEKRDQLTVSVRHLPEPEKVVVQHPNGYGKKSETFSPYVFPDVVTTSLFEVTIVNHGSATLEMNNLRFEITRDSLPVRYFEKKELVEKWNKYYYLNTNTVTGAPNFMEQERALVAEKYILLNHFSPLDLPPGAMVKGYLATEPIDTGDNVKIELFNLLPGHAPGGFTFQFSKN